MSVASTHIVCSTERPKLLTHYYSDPHKPDLNPDKEATMEHVSTSKPSKSVSADDVTRIFKGISPVNATKTSKKGLTNKCMKRVTAKEVRLVTAVWDFDKEPYEQDRSTIDLGEKLLLIPRMIPRGGFPTEGLRAHTVGSALIMGLEYCLRALGLGPPTHAKRDGKPVLVGYGLSDKLPQWMRIPYIVIEAKTDWTRELDGMTRGRLRARAK